MITPSNSPSNSQLSSASPDSGWNIDAETYSSLRRIAGAHMRHERRDHTLSVTALVNEAYLKLVRQRWQTLQSKSQWFALVSRIMHRILVDYSRMHARAKRGGDWRRVQQLQSEHQVVSDSPPLLPLRTALQKLALIDARQAKIVELKVFNGLSVQEIAAEIGVCDRTVKRDWSVAKAWLYCEMYGGRRNESSPMGNS